VRHGVSYLFAHFVQRLLVFAKNLDGNLRVDARYEFVIAGLYNLRKVELNAGSLPLVGASINQLVFRICRCPLILGFQPNV